MLAHGSTVQGMLGRLTVFGVQGLPEIEAGDDVAAMVHATGSVVDGDIVVVTSKVVSKAEGAVVELTDVTPSAFATRWAEQWDKDPRLIEVVLAESRRIVRQINGVLITETHQGLVCANSGVDQSSSGAGGRVVVLPDDADASARTMRRRFAELGADVAVIVSDTFGRPWRNGQTDVAIGIAGMNPMQSYIGQHDPHGHEFRVQELCVADELASAAELVKGNTSRVPAAIIRHLAWDTDDEATMRSVIREASLDLFR